MSDFVLCYFSATSMELPSLSSAVSSYRSLGRTITVNARTQSQLFSQGAVKRFVEKAMASDVVFITLHGGRMSCPAFEELVAAMELLKSEGKERPLFIIQSVGGDEEALLAAKDHGDCFGDERGLLLHRYFTFGGVENFLSLLKYLCKLRFETAEEIPLPLPLPTEGIYHPDLLENCDLPAYLRRKSNSDAPTIGIWFYQGYAVNRNTAHIDALIREIERQGAFALPVFSYRLKDEILQNLGSDDVVDTFFTQDGKKVVDVVISVMGMSISLTHPQFEKVLPKLDVPYLQALVSSVPYAGWKESIQGMSTMDVTFQAAQPEFDGALITVPVASREEDALDPITGGMTARNAPIVERTQKLVSLSLNWARLRYIPNSKKRVAVVFHHYPPRNDRIGCAAGLDSFASVKLLIDRLKDEGYEIARTFENGDALANALLEKLTCDRRYLTPEKLAARAEAHAGPDLYDDWHNTLPEDIKDKMNADWGVCPGDLFFHDDQLHFPGVVNGNLFITIQPPRGYFEHQDAMLHDLYLSPPHHYLAFYRWMKEIFKAHAVIHVGKHGSLEWLPGKAFGLSKSCYPDLSIMDLPNIYPYIINDPSEGTQAKRRSYCTIVDHLTPVFTNADLYEDMGDVERILSELRDAARQDPGKVPVLHDMLWEAVKAADLHDDLQLTEEMLKENSEHFMGAVHGYLSELSDNMINDGLHVLGVSPNNERLVEVLAQFTRHANGDVPSLRESVIEAMGFEVEAVLAHRGESFPGSGELTGGEIIGSAHETCLTMIRYLWERGYGLSTADEAVIHQFGAPMPKVSRALKYICKTLIPKILQTSEETDAIVHGLNGGFIAPGPSGAPTRGQADILPTGRNFYSVDPRVIPTKAAYETGARLGEALLARFLQETKAYPRSVGMIVWGGNTMRSKGDDIGEILYLMGIKPVWQSNGVVIGLEPIPLSVLGRPRIDVVPRISGFFRDAFPNLVELIDRAVHMVAALEESHDSNFIRKHIMSDQESYKKAGKTDDESFSLAALRVFGCPPGTYGAGVEELIESKNWETRKDLADNYIRYSAHAYSRAVYGSVEPEVFKTLLGRMDVTVKNEDSREYDMLSCTDFYNYYGGLIAAAESIRGESVKSYVGDASDPKRVGLRSTKEEAKFVLRSRLLNPKWIEGMKRHGYKGAGDISKVMDILIGWDATAEVMEDWMYDRVAKTYALDPKMQEWLREVNPYALLNITEKLLETIRRGMWNADKETEEQLKNAFLEVEGDIEDTIQ